MVAPNILLTLFGVPETHEVWIRVVGMLVLIVGYLDFMASRHELQIFFAWTVPPRFCVPAFLATFVILGWAPPYPYTVRRYLCCGRAVDCRLPPLRKIAFSRAMIFHIPAVPSA